MTNIIQFDDSLGEPLEKRELQRAIVEKENAFNLKQEKNRFTVIYPCQFCGRLINYAFTPCIFCGRYPRTKKEAVIAQLLSSNSLKKFNSILGVSKAIKDHADLDIVIDNIREIVDDALENEDKYPNCKTFFHLTELLAKNEEKESLKGSEYVKRSSIACGQCGSNLLIANRPCYNCLLTNQDNKEYSPPVNNLSPLEKQIFALNSFLIFVEKYLHNVENEESFEELVFMSVYMLNRLVEQNENPSNDLMGYWKENLNKTHILWANLGGEEIKGTIIIENNEVRMEILEKTSAFEQFFIQALGVNLSYLLES